MGLVRCLHGLRRDEYGKEDGEEDGEEDAEDDCKES
jgi:hypothetical protein